jgi:hypothetical protein
VVDGTPVVGAGDHVALVYDDGADRNLSDRRCTLGLRDGQLHVHDVHGIVACCFGFDGRVGVWGGCLRCGAFRFHGRPVSIVWDSSLVGDRW